MRDIAFRCPMCGFTALKSEGCHYCNPEKEVPRKEDQPASQEAGPAAEAAPNSTQLTLSL